MSQTITIAKFRDVSEGLQPGQFAIGDREVVSSLDSLDPIYKELLDRPITITLGLIGPDGRVSLTPMWFDYDGDHVLVNTAAHRSKCGWIRNNPELTILVVNPDNPYHWVQIKCTVEREELEEGEFELGIFKVKVNKRYTFSDWFNPCLLYTSPRPRDS